MKNLVITLVLLLFVSCNMQKDVIYMQDRVINTEVETIQGGEIRLKANDVISIVVTSKNPELSQIFNLPISRMYAGSTSTYGLTTSQGDILGYTIDENGCIDFPILGTIEIGDKTRLEVATYINKLIVDSGLLKDPIVTVDFINLKISILGEVSKPGQYSITRDKMTVLEALSMAGDLTITGERDGVFLTRKMDDKLITYQLDLKSTDIYQSPAFYIQQDDMIYVEPNRMRSNQYTANGNTFSTSSFWISLASLLTTITVLIVN